MAGARRSAFERFALTPLLEDMAELYGAVAEERGLRLEKRLAPGLSLFGDRALVQQAVANLLDNALKFSPEGGLITLEAAPEGAGVEIAVSDQGPGIPPADRAHASERFFRGEAARSTPGFGLGLALVQAVTQLHGGALRLMDAEPGLSARIFLQNPPGPPGPRPNVTPR